MALIVQKFGGSSLEGPERFGLAADRIAAARRRGDAVIAVLSARGGATDRLLGAAKALDRDPPPRELDLLLSAGEQIAAAEMAMALHARGLPAEALTGWQADIRTDGVFGGARILSVGGGRVRRALAEGKIVLAAGFQGVSADGEITTLGRGGSDTTAVALAAFLRADRCVIYTDVDGVCTADPREVSGARTLPAVSWDDMLLLAEAGAKVLHSRCVALAREHGLSFEVRSAATDAPGTVVGPGDGCPCCGLAVRRGLFLPESPEPAARLTLVGAACGGGEARMRRALRGLRVLKIVCEPRCAAAFVPESEAAEAAARLHAAFLAE